MLNLTITHSDGKMSRLNGKLVEKQGLDQDRVNILKALHQEMHNVKKEFEKTDDPVELHELALTVEGLEFMMQEAWGFEKNRDYHTHWIDVPKCTCPKMDNKENYGTKYRIIRDDCPVHGKLK